MLNNIRAHAANIPMPVYNQETPNSTKNSQVPVYKSMLEELVASQNRNMMLEYTSAEEAHNARATCDWVRKKHNLPITLTQRGNRLWVIKADVQ